MKKLLSLLLLMAVAATAYADCVFYIDDYQVSRSDIANGTEITVPVKASFTARLNTWDLYIEYPEHMIPTYIEAGADMTITYYNSRGRETTAKAALYGAAEPWDHVIGVLGEAGFWQDPNGEDPTAWVTYGVVKWEGGIHEEMLLLSFIIEEGFEGGDVVFKTECASGVDERGGTIRENGDHKGWHDYVSHVTLQPVTDTPEINYVIDDDKAVITATGEGEVLLYANGELVENPYTVARGEEDAVYTFTATAQAEGKEISETAKLALTIPAKLPPVYGVGLKKMWSVPNIMSQMPEGLVANDMRQGFGMNGKFYINSKKEVLDSASMTYTTVPTVYVLDENGRVETTYPGGLNCGITRDEAGNLVISNMQFPNNWNETATLKVINPETNVTKVYTVPEDCGITGRCDFIGFAQGDLMEDGVIYLVGSTTTGVGVMTITGGEVNTDECFNAPCDGLSPTTNTVVNYYKDLAGEDAMLYVTRNAAPVKMKFDGNDLVGTAFTLPNKGAANGLFPFIWNDKELFLYPTLPNYLDGFAIGEAGAEAPLYEVQPTVAANPNGIQCNWLNAEVDEDGVTVYQYVPNAYVAVYRLGEFERTQKPVITYEVSEENVTIIATGSGDVQLYVNGEPVENPYTIARGEEDVTVTVTATAHQSDKLVSEEETLEVLIPALPAKTEMPIITYQINEEDVVITAQGEGEVMMYVNGDYVDNPYTIIRGEENVTVTIVATAQGEGKRISDPAELELIIPALPAKTDMPVITYEVTEDAVTITATGEGEVLMYVNGEPVENPYTIARGEEDITIGISATAQGEGKRISDYAYLDLVIPALPAKTEAPVITYELTDEAVIITAAGEGEVLLYVNGELVENPCTIARTEEAVMIYISATAQGEGKRISDPAYMELIIPAYEVTAAPAINVETTKDEVIITATGDGDVLLYVNGELVENPYTIARDEENDIVITVVATAKEDGKLMSSTEMEVVVPKKESEGVDELLGNKTIASVRYFNMAGQEMSEAKGVTIIVTTYTDGTHNTVKVIK